MTELYFEQFVAYVSANDVLASTSPVRSSDLTDSFLWLLDEGHCFRDQIVRFCGIKDGQTSKNVYSLGSIETFMRMVEGGRGITFIPELALYQLSESQRTRPPVRNTHTDAQDSASHHPHLRAPLHEKTHNRLREGFRSATNAENEQHRTARVTAQYGRNDCAVRKKMQCNTTRATAQYGMSRHTITAIPQYGREPDAIQKLMSGMSVHTGRLHENTKK